MAAPTILWRYILREVGLYTLLGLTALAILLLVGNLLKDLQLLQIVGGDLKTIARLFLVILPAYLTYIVPAALLCGVMISLSRLSADGEIVAMRASGMSMAPLVPPVALLGLVSVAISAFVSFDLEPRSHLELKVLRRELVSTHSLIEPGRVRPMGTARTLYVAEEGDPSCPLRGVVISDFRRSDRPYYVAATCGSIVELENEGFVALDLSRGAVHLAHAGANRYDRIAFESSVLELDLDELAFFRKRLNHYTFRELFGSMIGSNYSQAQISTEIQRRLAFPLSGLVLGLLAVPLGIRPSRRGRSAGTLLAVLVMGAYWCVFTTCQLAAEDQMIPPWTLWLPNATVLALACWGLRRSARSDV